jgi:hypothetical protein
VLINLLVFDRLAVKDCGCPKVVSHNFVGIFVLLSVIFVASLFYYLFTLKIDQKQKIISSNIKTLYSILDEDEKHLFDMIIANSGSINQSDVSKKYGKIKAHRLTQKLKQKNVVYIIKERNQNKIFIKQNLKQVIK